MKRILAPIVLLTFLFPSLAYGVTMDDLVVRGGLWYEKFNDVPFTGKTTGKTQGTFRNGKKDGPWVYYRSNGQLRFKGTLKNGKREGHWVHYHLNGQLWDKGTYKDGKRDGPWVGYNKDGTVRESDTGTFKDGVKVK
jgi:antitoxin component YwqK of YwqJK toxin-antitoxin module